MNQTQQAKASTLSPLERTARHYVAELLKMDSRGPDTAENNLSRVRSLREFLAIGPVGMDILTNFRNLPRPSFRQPEGTETTPRNGIEFPRNTILTQKVPAAGELPAYTFPLPGQPVLLIGSPFPFSVPDGARYDTNTRRWECEDARIVALSPMGLVVLTVDVGEFTPWEEASPVWSEVLEACGSLLVQLEADIVAAAAEASK